MSLDGVSWVILRHDVTGDLLFLIDGYEVSKEVFAERMGILNIDQFLYYFY